MLYVALLYASLADPVYESRESATARLTHLVSRYPSLYGPRLAEWYRGCPCPETRSRCLPILSAYVRWRVDSFVPPCPLWPISDAFPIACPVIPFALEDVRDRWQWPVESSPHMPSHNSGSPYWIAYRRTTERRVREAIREGMSHEAASDLVRRMWRLEVRSKHDCGYVTPWAP